MVKIASGQSLPSEVLTEALSNVDLLRSGVEPVFLRIEYISCPLDSLLVFASLETCRMVGSIVCTLFDDFDAFRFEKNDLD